MSSSALQVVEHAAEIARHTFGPRLRAAYVLGSLAHGGFSPAVSDLDLALVLAHPLEPGDAADIEAILHNQPLRAMPLADRLSIFWGSVETLRGDAAGGRFPAADRLDLLAHGRILAGEDIRAGLPRPSHEQLVTEGAEVLLQIFAMPGFLTVFAMPSILVGLGAQKLTKAVLFPARLLYTLRTGEMAGNRTAAEHYAQSTGGPRAALVEAALSWRDSAEPPPGESAIAMLQSELSALYLECLQAHVAYLAQTGRRDLTQPLAEWLDRVAAARA